MLERRQNLSRRRRVISATLLSDSDGASRTRGRAVADDEERVTRAYGSRVNRRLRARWFELVPVKPAHYFSVGLFIVSVSVCLGLGHYLSVTWPPLRDNPDLSRPIRLDNPAGFGGWISSTWMLLAAGASFLIYQLRRYRADDYHGRYRIWRPVIAFLLLLSIDSIAGLLTWSGTVLDIILAGRAPMAGGDWLRLVLCVLGLAFTARLAAEMCSNVAATCWLIIGAAGLVSGLPIRWHLAEPSPLTSILITGAGPLLGRAAILLALIAFLRSCYCEVRGLGGGEAGRVRLPRFGRSKRHEDLEDEEQDEEESEPRGWRGIFAKSSSTDVWDEYGSEEESPRRRWFGRKQVVDEEDVDPDESEYDDEAFEDVDNEKGKRRGWFGRRRVDAAEDVEQEDEEELEEVESEKNARRGWFGRGRGESTEEVDQEEPEKKKRGWFNKKSVAASDEPPERDDQEAETRRGWFSKRKKDEQGSDDSEEAPESESKSSRRGLGGWLRRNKGDEDAETQSNEPSGGNKPLKSKETSSDSEEDAIDVDNIDWASMSKSERRRMKKLLRRQGKDAA